MPEKRIKLIFPEGYSVQGFDIIGLWGRPMKENRKGHVRLQRTGEKPYDVSRLKLVWAAKMNIDVRKIPKKYSFYLDDNGNLQVDKFSDRMSRIVSERTKEVKVKREDYAFVEKYAHIALQMLDGDNDAKGQLFALINGKREMFIQYARRSGGGISEEKAILYTDMAISYTYDLICSGRYYVPSPIGSVKGKINQLIKANRKKRTLFKNEQ